MSVNSIQPTWRIDYAHTEELYQAFSSLTIDPLKHILYYVFPFLKIYASGHIELIRNTTTQGGMMPLAGKTKILDEVQELIRSAGMRKTVHVYAALNHSFSCSGGKFSLTAPALFIPYQHLFRPNQSLFTEERQEEGLAEKIWNYSDDETRFLIGRELVQIQNNNGLLRVAVKVAFLSALTLFYTHPFGWMISTVICVAFTALYIGVERYFEAKADEQSVQIVAKRIRNPERAARAAIRAFEKMLEQNRERRKESKFCRLYISEQGENHLDWFHSPFSQRIAFLKRRFQRV